MQIGKPGVIMSSNDYANDYETENEVEDDSTSRTVWEVFSWIAVVLTILLNLAIIVIIFVRKNFYSAINKGLSNIN